MLLVSSHEDYNHLLHGEPIPRAPIVINLQFEDGNGGDDDLEGVVDQVAEQPLEAELGEEDLLAADPWEEFAQFMDEQLLEDVGLSQNC